MHNNHLFLTLLVSSLVLVGCGKKTTTVQEPATERYSGPLTATDIVWEEIDQK